MRTTTTSYRTPGARARRPPPRRMQKRHLRRRRQRRQRASSCRTSQRRFVCFVYPISAYLFLTPANQPSLPPSSTMAPQREMSWTAIPVFSLPATQPPQFQPAPAFTDSSFAPAQYQARPTSFWPQSAVSAPSTTSTWMAPPAPALSSSAWVSPPQSFYQPIAIPQLPSFVQPAAPPPGEDMSMDVDLFVDVRASRRGRPARDYRRAAYDRRRAARQLLRVAAVEPSLHLRKRVARRLFQHLLVVRQHPVPTHPFQDRRAIRRGLVVQRRNRQALRRARRSVRRTLKRLGRAARPGRGAPQPLQPSMSVEMAIESPSSCLFDEDVDMDSGDVPAVPAMEVTTEMMASEDAFPSSAPPIPSESSIPVDLPIPIIIITPDSPQPQPQSQAELRAADSAPPLAVSFVPEPTVTVAFDSAKYAVVCPPREESSLAEFEVPLVEAAAPAPVIDHELVPAAEAVVEAPRPSADDAGERTDDETEWESVPIPAVAISPPTAEPAPVEESTPPTESAPVEQETSTEPLTFAPDVLAPNIAEEGPEIVFYSDKTQEDDAEDAVSLGHSEEERERQLISGEDGEDEDEEDEDGEYDDDGEEEDEETDEEEDEEDNEYDESAPMNPVERPSAPAPAPPSAPVSSPAVGAAPVEASASPSTPLPIPSTLPPSSAPTSLTGGPHIGIVMEGYNPAADIRQLLTDQANVSSGTRLSGAAAQEERAQARLRNHAHQAQQKKAAQDLIRSIAVKAPPLPEAASSPMSCSVAFETTASRLPADALTAVDKGEPKRDPHVQDRVMAEQAPAEDALMPAEEEASIVSPRRDKGKGKAKEWDAPKLVARAPTIDTSVQEIIGALDLSPAEVRLNLDAFSPANAEDEADLGYRCCCTHLSDGPSSGHTLACQNARGVRTAPSLAWKLSSDSGVGTYPTSAPSPLGTHQVQQLPSVLKTEVNTTPLDQGEWQSRQSSVCSPPTRPPVAREHSSPVNEFVNEDMEQQLTGLAKAWADAFAAPIQAPTAVQSLPETQDLWVSAPDCTVQPLHASTLLPATIDPSVLDLSAELQKVLDAILPGTSTSDDAATDQEILFTPAETAPFAGLDFSTLAFGPGADLALDEQLRDLLFSVPDQANAIFVDDPIVYDSVPQDMASVLPVSASVDGISVVFSQVNEGDIAASRAGDHEEMREVDTGSVSCPLVTPSNDEQQEQHSEASALGYARLEEPQLESNISVLAAGSPQADSRTEPSVQEAAFLQPQPPSEQSLPADWVPPPLVDLAGPFPPARAPTPPPSVPLDGVAYPVAEEHTEEPEHVEGAPSPASEQEAEDGSSAPDVSVPSTSLVRRRSGGPHDRIACPHEKRTYYGPRPCSTQWRAFLQACPSRVNRLPSWNVTDKSLSPSSSSVAPSPACLCGPSRLRTTSTLPETSTIAEPWHSRLPSRGRPRRRPTAPTAMDQFKSKKDVATQTTKLDATAATTKKRKSNGKGNSKKETHVPPSSSSSAPHPPRLIPSDLPCPPQALRLPSWVEPPCCPKFSRTGREPCIHVLRATGQLAGTRWESESSESDLEEEKDVSWPQGWSAGYLAKLSLAVGACYLLENVVF
ncbi:hypothetical protein LXA43DRAFT_213354 [Ganoderma leucocontextum]|nr:hypothetical protein LXA43DRAFT_213354 [Ganoderma leucocontextum]